MTDTQTTDVGGIAADRLRSFVERIESEEERKKEHADAVKDIYQQAKSDGYDVKILRAIIRRRRMDRQEVQEHDELLELYEANLGG